VDDTRHQNFTGWKKSAGDSAGYWRKAVDATLTASTVTAVRPSSRPEDSGRIAETVYFASSGRGTGFGTVSNTLGFGSGTPVSYLSPVVDPYSAAAPGNPYLKWERSFTQAKLQAVLGVPAVIRSVAVTERYQGGLLKTLVATGSTGARYTITKAPSGWRSAFGAPAAWIGAVTGT
ncbi:MAG: hypothetical protein AAGC63_11925, partial [Propionicimonas sp.]